MESDPKHEEIKKRVQVIIKNNPQPTSNSRRLAARENVLVALTEAGRRGLLKKEIAIATELKITMIAAVLRDLKKSGRVEPAGRWVWRIVKNSEKKS